MAVYVSLFRAINVGGNSKVSMADLKAVHEGLGLTNIKTYLQTGNVVFESEEETAPAKLAASIKHEFEKKFGFGTEVMVRSAADLQKIESKNPFLKDADKATKWVVVLFLTDSPAEKDFQALKEAYKGPEEMVLKGQELYAYYSESIGHSKLTNVLIEKKLKVLGTGRNWNTVSKLIEMIRPTE